MNKKTMKYSKLEVREALNFSGMNLKTFSAMHGFNYQTVREYVMIYCGTGKEVKGKKAIEIMELLEKHVENLRMARKILQEQEREKND